jgi:hypothetical protein
LRCSVRHPGSVCILGTPRPCGLPGGVLVGG